MTESTIRLAVKPEENTEPPSAKEGAKSNKQAGFLSRFIAFGIDLMIVALFTELMTLLSLLMSRASSSNIFSHSSLFAFALFFFNIFLLAYFVWFYTMYGKTVGKMMLGIRVVAYKSSEVGLFRACLRSLGYYLSSFFFAGFLWAIFDEDAQGWHDKLAGTVVIDDDNKAL